MSVNLSDARLHWDRLLLLCVWLWSPLCYWHTSLALKPFLFRADPTSAAPSSASLARSLSPIDSSGAKEKAKVAARRRFPVRRISRERECSLWPGYATGGAVGTLRLHKLVSRQATTLLRARLIGRQCVGDVRHIEERKVVLRRNSETAESWVKHHPRYKSFFSSWFKMSFFLSKDKAYSLNCTLFFRHINGQQQNPLNSLD